MRLHLDNKNYFYFRSVLTYQQYTLMPSSQLDWRNGLVTRKIVEPKQEFTTKDKLNREQTHYTTLINKYLPQVIPIKIQMKMIVNSYMMPPTTVTKKVWPSFVRCMIATIIMVELTWKSLISIRSIASFWKTRKWLTGIFY